MFGHPGFHEQIFLDDVPNQPITQKGGQPSDGSLGPIVSNFGLEFTQCVHQPGM